MDTLTSCLFFAVLVLLTAATLAVSALRRYVDYGVDPAVLDTFRTRIRAWWILFGALACVFVFGPVATTFFFFLLSIGVLREYITLTPKSPVDHQTLFWIYIFFTPLQFLLVGINPNWFASKTGLIPYQIFCTLLPGYVFLILPGFMATSGDPKRFLERLAKLQLGLMICVYALSYTPALLTLELPQEAVPAESATASVLADGLERKIIGIFPRQETIVEWASVFNSPKETNEAEEINEAGKANETNLESAILVESESHLPFSPPISPPITLNPNDIGTISHTSHITSTQSNNTDEKSVNVQTKDISLSIFPEVSGRHFGLLFFFVLIVQLGDVFQYIWSQASRRHLVAPNINANRSWEGVFGGAATTALLGVALWYWTPFPKWWHAALIAFVVSLMGFAGNMTMSAIKRDRGVSGYGSLIHGHSGILDRIDSLCFAAPVFYHLTWFFTR
ncbi:MAG: phosphatidate cytidylyltransferase [Thermoguttaceae bacterium]